MMLRKSLYRPSCLVHTFGCQSMIVARSVWQTKCNLNENFSIQFLNFQTRAGERDRGEPMRTNEENQRETRREPQRIGEELEDECSDECSNRLVKPIVIPRFSLYQLTLSTYSITTHTRSTIAPICRHLLWAFASSAFIRFSIRFSRIFWWIIAFLTLRCGVISRWGCFTP